MIRPAVKRLAAAAGLGALLLAAAGCLKLGPDYQKPASPAPLPASFEHVSQPGSYPAMDKWWRVFANPKLDELVELALARNLDLQMAGARVLQVRARLVQSQANHLPSVGAEAEAQRYQSPTSDLPAALASRAGPTSSFNLTLAASFELDLWGRLSRATEAARADLLAAEENRRTVGQGVVAAVVSTFLQQEALERRLATARVRIKVYQDSLDLVRSRYQRGLASALTLRQARRSLAVAQASLPQLKMELGRIQQDLAVLVGRYPSTSPERSLPQDYYRSLPAVPPGLPSELLQRRPDVRAAEAQLRALNARVGAAKATRFPTIKLTGAWGTSSSELSDLFTPASELWSLAAGLSQPIFDAGRLAANQRAAEAAYQEGLASYAKTVLSAFAEVENALLTRQEQVARRELVQKALAEAEGTYQHAQSRYQAGLVGYLNVLDAQKVLYELAEDLILTELAVLTNQVTLHRALGGGWENLPPVAARAQ